jgi:hypothetical protein
MNRRTGSRGVGPTGAVESQRCVSRVSEDQRVPKVGEFVAAKFSEDGEWYRARVRRNDRENKKSDVNKALHIIDVSVMGDAAGSRG